MKATKKRVTQTPAVIAAFERVADAFARDRQVGRGMRKGFGSGALTVKGRIFAMISSKGQFVVKLPKAGVDELVAAGAAEVFEPRPGRLMKEWAVVLAPTAEWIGIAKEACAFAKRSGG